MSAALDLSPARRRTWRPYLAMARIGFLNYLAYRTTVVLILLVFIIEAVIHCYLWEAVFAGQARIAGYTLPQMLTYVTLAWALRAFYNNHSDRELGEKIRSGAIISELVLPMNVQLARLSQLYGRALTRLLTTAGPFTLVLALSFPLVAPASLGHGLLFALTAITSLAIYSGFNFITGTTAFFTEGYAGICSVKAVLVGLLSGAFIPYALLPAPVQTVLQVLPFRGLADLPINLYLGTMSLESGLWQTALQLAWAVAILAFGHGYWQWSARYQTIDGG